MDVNDALGEGVKEASGLELVNCTETQMVVESTLLRADTNSGEEAPDMTARKSQPDDDNEAAAESHGASPRHILPAEESAVTSQICGESKMKVDTELAVQPATVVDEGNDPLVPRLRVEEPAPAGVDEAPDSVAALGQRAEECTAGHVEVGGETATAQPTDLQSTLSAAVMDVDGEHREEIQDAVNDGYDEDYDDDEEEALSDPPKDTTVDLERIISKCFKFDGAFSFARGYPAAPNPCIQVETLGNVGLPLSCRDAQAIIHASAQATLGDGGQTIVGREEQRNWEMDASKLHLGNPLWATFIQGIVNDVCTPLGVNIHVSKPRCELHKLLLSEPGSQFLPHIETEKQDGMFATVVVVLPSQFTGGVDSLSHGALSVRYDASANSLSNTTVLARYTGVTHATTPITSGYRLALVYNLAHTTNAPRPALVWDADLVAELRQVLVPWQRHAGVDNVPEKITFMLMRKYEEESLRPTDLTGQDASMLAVLQVLALELGFHIGFALIELCSSGNVARQRRLQQNKYGEYEEVWGDDDDDGYEPIDSDNLELDHVDEREFSVDDLVSLDGIPLRTQVDCEDWESVPVDIVRAMEKEDHDEDEYDKMEGTVRRHYRRTALVIWPDAFHFTMAYGEYYSTAAIDEIRNTRSATPTMHEQNLINFVLGSPHLAEHEKTFPTLYCAACAWKDLRLWERVMDMLGGGDLISKLSTENIFQAIGVFGMSAVCPRLEVHVKVEPSNTARWQFVRALASDAPQDLREAVQDWTKEQKLQIARTLTNPTEHDLPLMLEMAAELGITFFEDTILGQLEGNADAGFLLACGERMYAARSSLVRSADDEIILQRMRADLLSTAVSKADLYQKTLPGPAPSPALAHSFLESCLALGEDDLTALIVEKLSDMAGQTADEAQSRARTVLIPLLPLLQRSLGAHPVATPIPGLRALVMTAVRLFLDSKAAGRDSLREADMHAIVHAVRLGGGTALLSRTVIPKLKALPWDETGWRTLLDGLRARRGEYIFQTDGGAQMDAILADMVKTYAANVSMPSHSAAANANSGYSGTAKIVDVLDVCCATESAPHASAATVLARALDTKLATPAYITQVLVPLIADLRRFLEKRCIPPASEPFKGAFCRIMRYWKDKVLGPKPPDATAQFDSIRRYSCSCAPCTEIRQFLLVDGGVQLTLHAIGAATRKHVESKLGTYVAGAATWKATRKVKRSVSPDFIVTKKDAIWKPVKWKAEQARGLAIVKTISASDEELQAILKGLYAPLMTILQGQAPPLADAPLASGPSQPTGQPANVASGVASVSGTAITYPFASGSTSGAGFPVGICSAPLDARDPATPPHRKRKHCDEVIDVCTP